MKKAFIFDSGCACKALDKKGIHDYLLKNEWELTNRISSADVIVINTCGAMDKRERLSLATVQDITRQRSLSATVIITGCLPKVDPVRIEEIGDFIYIPTLFFAYPSSQLSL